MLPTWYFVGIGVLACLGIVGIIAAVIVAKKVDCKVDRMLAATWRDDAVAHSACIIRNGALSCPGVALAAEDTLFLHPVLGKALAIPLSRVTVTREIPGSGPCEWWGKRVFHLDTPETSNLKIGVQDPVPWRKAFARRGDAPGAKPS